MMVHALTAGAWAWVTNRVTDGPAESPWGTMLNYPSQASCPPNFKLQLLLMVTNLGMLW